MSKELSLAAMLTDIVAVADKERENSDAYKDLFEGSSDIESLLRSTEHAMTDAVLSATSVLKKKFGYENISNEAYYLLLALPIMEHTLEKHIKNTQGRSCSVDKTYYHLANQLREALEKNG